MNVKIDRPALHRYWWERTDKNGCIEINQSTLAEELGVERGTIRNIVRDMKKAGQIELFEAQKQGRRIWRIYDPDNPGHTKTPNEADEKVKQLQWG